MFEQAFKNIDGLEQDKAMEAELEGKLSGKPYAFILDEAYRWSSWAAPKDKDGKQRPIDAATAETLLRLMQSVPSPKAEPIKLWLAKVDIQKSERPRCSHRGHDAGRELPTHLGIDCRRFRQYRRPASADLSNRLDT